MKRNNNSKFFLLMLLASIGFFPACDSFTDFGDTNVDPNRTNKPVTAALITNAITGMGAGFINEVYIANILLNHNILMDHYIQGLKVDSAPIQGYFMIFKM